MKGLIVILFLATIGCSFAFLKKCDSDAECAEGQCCLFGRRCLPRLPDGSLCNLMNEHGCGCAEGSSCQVTYSKTVLGKTFSLRQCVKDKDDDAPGFAKRFLIRKCSLDSVAEDCGKERCCIGGKYCSPLIPKYIPCNLEDSHKCACVAGLECKPTKELKIPLTGISISLKQCMPVGENVEIETVELRED